MCFSIEKKSVESFILVLNTLINLIEMKMIFYLMFMKLSKVWALEGCIKL